MVATPAHLAAQVMSLHFSQWLLPNQRQDGAVLWRKAKSVSGLKTENALSKTHCIVFICITNLTRLLSAAASKSLIVLRWTCPLISIEFRSLVVELTTKPVLPTSTSHTCTSQPRPSAAKMTVPSIRMLHRGTFPTGLSAPQWRHGGRTRSGCRLVTTFSGGKVSLWLRSTRTSQTLAVGRGTESRDDFLVRRFSIFPRG